MFVYKDHSSVLDPRESPINGSPSMGERGRAHVCTWSNIRMLIPLRSLRLSSGLTRRIIRISKVYNLRSIMDLSPTRQNLRDQEAHERIQDERPTKKARLEDGERTDNMIQPRKTTKQKQKLSKRALQKILHHEPGTPGDVLWHEINELLGRNIVDDAIVAGRDLEASVQFGDILELDVVEISSTGDSLSILPAPHPPWVVATPFSLPGERIRVKIVRNGRMLSHADLLGIVQSNQALRDDSRVKCRYFGECSGCQYQMLDYATQLDFKRHVIQKAYRFYSNLSAEMIPSPSPTIASPLQYGYRTKITPHFDEPPKGKARSAWIPWIGFDSKGRRRVLDIEECPIATSTLNQALGPIRKEVQEQIDNYKRGATLLMRDSLATIPQQDGDETHVCIRDHKAIVRERVGTTLFEFPANSFFQNNNSVLVPLTDYVREAALSVPADGKTKQPTHLIDTYSGCGLFALRLVDSFDRVVGIEISEESIRYATHNVKLNGIPEDKCEFRAGQAERIFEVVQDFPPKETAIVIDPPRKGCDDKFIEQLLSFGAATIVYVSCNVHTQARDVGKIVSGGRDYTVESIRGFDLFPQTAHVESVAILRRG